MSHATLLPGVTVADAGPVTVYSVARLVRAALVIERSTPPLFVTVNVWGLLVLPTSMPPNASDDGLGDACCAVVQVSSESASAPVGSLSLDTVTVVVRVPVWPAGGTHLTGMVLLGGTTKLVSVHVVVLHPAPPSNTNQPLCI